MPARSQGAPPARRAPGRGPGPAFASALAALLCGAAGAASGCGREAARKAEDRKAAEALTGKAEACLAEGRYDCAMEAYAAALKKRPGAAELLNHFAMAARLRYYVTGEADYRDQELDALRRAAKASPGAAPVQVNLGTTCWELGLHREAAEAYRAALKLAPDHPDAPLLRARIQRAPEAEEDEPEAE